jgi:hypothetical protein
MPHGPIPDKPKVEFDPETGCWYGEPITFPPDVVEAWRNAGPTLIEDPQPQAGSPTLEQIYRS